MKNEFSYGSVGLIYPGTYVPIQKEETINSAVKNIQDDISHCPPVNVTVLPDSYKIEVAIPGVNKEDFMIHIDGNDLCICALQNNVAINNGENFQLHEFNYQCFNRHIILPGHTDAELASAEYQAGILRLFIPKAETPGTNVHTSIVIY